MDNYDVKHYLEHDLEFKTVNCTHSKQAIIYVMKHPCGVTMHYEILGTGALQFTIGDESRTVPSFEELTRILKHEPTELEVVRLAGQVVTKMLEHCGKDTHSDIQKQFKRYGSR